MNPINDVRIIHEADEYAIWCIDDFDMNSLQTRAAIPAINRRTGKTFSYASVHAVLKYGGTWATGTLSVMVSNEWGAHMTQPETDMVAHPDSITKTAGGSGWASAPFELGHYWLGFQPTLIEGGTSLLKIYVMLKA